MIARLIVLSLMLIIAFTGLILTDVFKTGAFLYWQCSAVAYAALALFLSWYERRDASIFKPVTLLKEILHWLGLNASVYLISIYVDLGIASRFEAGLFVLNVLALAVYLAGIYIEVSFCFIGIVLGLFAWIVAFFEEYLYALSIPILLFSIGALFWYLFHHKRKVP
jgi:hypothetical protein